MSDPALSPDLDPMTVDADADVDVDVEDAGVDPELESPAIPGHRGDPVGNAVDGGARTDTHDPANNNNNTNNNGNGSNRNRATTPSSNNINSNGHGDQDPGSAKRKRATLLTRDDKIRVLTLRRDAGWSYAQIAAKTGFTQRQIQVCCAPGASLEVKKPGRTPKAKTPKGASAAAVAATTAAQQQQQQQMALAMQASPDQVLGTASQMLGTPAAAAPQPVVFAPLLPAATAAAAAAAAPPQARHQRPAEMVPGQPAAEHPDASVLDPQLVGHPPELDPQLAEATAAAAAAGVMLEETPPEIAGMRQLAGVKAEEEGEGRQQAVGVGDILEQATTVKEE